MLCSDTVELLGSSQHCADIGVFLRYQISKIRRMWVPGEEDTIVFSAFWLSDKAQAHATCATSNFIS